MFTHEGPELEADDDGFHPFSDHWWETETAWFSFNVPDRALGGWFYNQILAVQGICNGGAWVWDDSSAAALYEQRHQGLALPEVRDLRDMTLPNGNSIKVLEPLMRYALRYDDPGRFQADVVFEATMPPHSHPVGVAPFWKGRHFDQPGRVRGHIVLDGERIDVDCISGRDRSWGPRPLGPDPRKPRDPRRRAAPRPETGVGYVFANATEDDGFLAYTLPHEDGSDDVTAGYLLRDGVYAPLVTGHRNVEFAPRTRFVCGIHLEATDELGRALVADGELVSHHGVSGPSGTGLFLWRWDGAEGWGEDQSFCSEKVWQAVGAPPPVTGRRLPPST
ncbi:MAG: DUF7065 domain-containing protein [Acidimicrobiales bacterium]